MMGIKFDIVSTILIPLESNWILDKFMNHTNHRFNLSYYTTTQLFGCITVPFIALPILHDASFPTTDNFSLVDGFLEHLIRLILNASSLWFFNILLGLVNDEFIGFEIVAEFCLDECSRLGCKSFDALVEWLHKSLKLGVDLFDDWLL